MRKSVATPVLKCEGTGASSFLSDSIQGSGSPAECAPYSPFSSRSIKTDSGLLLRNSSRFVFRCKNSLMPCPARGEPKAKV